MPDITDQKTSKSESQQFTSENNANTIHHDSTMDHQTNGNSKKLHDDTIYDNMIFPS